MSHRYAKPHKNAGDISSDPLSVTVFNQGNQSTDRGNPTLLQATCRDIVGIDRRTELLNCRGELADGFHLFRGNCHITRGGCAVVLGIPLLVCARPMDEGWVLFHLCNTDEVLNEVLALLLMLLVSRRVGHDDMLGLVAFMTGRHGYKTRTL